MQRLIGIRKGVLDVGKPGADDNSFDGGVKSCKCCDAHIADRMENLDMRFASVLLKTRIRDYLVGLFQNGLWAQMDEYIINMLHRADPELAEVLESSARAGLPRQHVSPPQGKFLMLLAMIRGARNILEIGSLGGYSAIWLARALPQDGRLITLEISPKHAHVARANIEREGFADRIELRFGAALDTLPKLIAEGLGPFDLIFIDANIPQNSELLKLSLKLSTKGTVIVVDNVIRSGRILEDSNPRFDVVGVRRFNETLAAVKGLSATEIQTVGGKGYDGFAIAVVTE
ncbi:MAG: O-methyltransferase [Arenicellales bacterium]